MFVTALFVTIANIRAMAQINRRHGAYNIEVVVFFLLASILLQFYADIALTYQHFNTVLTLRRFHQLWIIHLKV